MLKKILSAFLGIFIFTAVSGVNAFARGTGNENEEKTAVVKEKKKIEKKDFSGSFKTEKDSLSKIEKSAYSRAEYQKQKAQGSKFSTTTKVLIGVGIAAAVIGIVAFAVSRTEIHPF